MHSRHEITEAERNVQRARSTRLWPDSSAALKKRRFRGQQGEWEGRTSFNKTWMWGELYWRSIWEGQDQMSSQCLLRIKSILKAWSLIFIMISEVPSVPMKKQAQKSNMLKCRSWQMKSPGLEPAVLTPEKDQRRQDSVCMTYTRGLSVESHAKHLKVLSRWWNTNSTSIMTLDSLLLVCHTDISHHPDSQLAPALGEETHQWDSTPWQAILSCKCFHVYQGCPHREAHDPQKTLPTSLHCRAHTSVPGLYLPCHSQTLLLQDLTWRALLLDFMELKHVIQGHIQQPVWAPKLKRNTFLLSC